MTQRTADTHPRAQSPYISKVVGEKWRDAVGHHNLLFRISIIDSRTGEQVEGCEATSKRQMRETLWRRMASWRHHHAKVAAQESEFDFDYDPKEWE
jgi:hypothetical protein